MMTEPGAREPVYCTGLGKVLLAGIPEPERDTLIGGLVLEQKTGTTIATADGLRDLVRAVEEQGFAFDAEEFQPGASCIAVPVREYGGGVVAALSISGPAFRMAEPRLDDLVRLVTDAGRSVSRKVGYQIEKSDDLLDRGGSRRGRVSVSGSERRLNG
jgi:DNA-binding IclR family transcriptional regulator